jgi:hypothetical protein
MNFLEKILEPEVLRRTTLLYLASPLLISTVAIAGRNHVWLSPFLGLSLCFALRGRNLLSGIWSGLAVPTTKFLAIFLLPGILIRSQRKMLCLAGGLVLPAGVSLLLSHAGCGLCRRRQRSGNTAVCHLERHRAAVSASVARNLSSSWVDFVWLCRHLHSSLGPTVPVVADEGDWRLTGADLCR